MDGNIKNCKQSLNWLNSRWSSNPQGIALIQKSIRNSINTSILKKHQLQNSSSCLHRENIGEIKKEKKKKINKL